MIFEKNFFLKLKILKFWTIFEKKIFVFFQKKLSKIIVFYIFLHRNIIVKKKTNFFFFNFFLKKKKLILKIILLKYKKMSVPKNLKYTKDHEWVLIDGDNATIGITDFAQKELGDIVFIEIETEGEKLEEKEAFGTIEAVKTVSDMFMPISGEVIEVNPLLEEDPSIVNNDPYNKGWMIKITISNKNELENLISPEEYEELTA